MMMSASEALYERTCHSMTHNVRRSLVVGAVGCLLTVGAGVMPAAASPAGASGATVHCGAPKLEVWYDSDQFGTYLKAYFRSDPRCPRGVRHVENLSGTIYCKPNGGRVYRERVSGGTPVETIVKALPTKSKCQSFYAEGSILYRGWTQPYKDTWQWKWGDYPA